MNARSNRIKDLKSRKQDIAQAISQGQAFTRIEVQEEIDQIEAWEKTLPQHKNTKNKKLPRGYISMAEHLAQAKSRPPEQILQDIITRIDMEIQELEEQEAADARGDN